MRKKLFIFILLLSMVFTLSSGWTLPDWITPVVRKYPVNTYLFDVGMGIGLTDDSYNKAIIQAHRHIAGDIIQKVVRIIQFNHNDPNYAMVREHYSSVLEDYCSGRYAYPILKLDGFTPINLTVEMVRESDMDTYALLYIKRDTLKKIYSEKETELRNKIIRLLERAKGADDDLDINRALKLYLQTYPLYESLKEVEIIQIAADYDINSRKAFRNLTESATEIGEDFWSHRQVIKRVNELDNQNIVIREDIYNTIVSHFTQQTHAPIGNVSINPMIYKDSELVSPLSLEFTKSLKDKLPWTIVDSVIIFDPAHVEINENYTGTQECRISSSFWMNGEEITIRTILRNVNTGVFHGSSIVSFLKTDLRDSRNHVYTPRGYNAENNKEFNYSEPHHYIIKPNEDIIELHRNAPIGGLMVDVWTDKGRSPVLYHEGDKVQVYVRVNQPAFLRILYTLADNRQTILKDNFSISDDNIDKDVKIGEYLCTEPFGKEVLHVAARTERYQMIETRNEDGFDIIQESDQDKRMELYRNLPKKYSENRGLKKLEERQTLGPEPSFQQTEVRLTITTMKK